MSDEPESHMVGEQEVLTLRTRLAGSRDTFTVNHMIVALDNGD